MDTQAKECLASGLGDHRLISIEWSEDGNDLFLTFAPPSGSDWTLARRKMCLHFLWVTNVRLSLDFGEYAGIPLLYESAVHRLEEGPGWEVTLQFGAAPTGHITFVCNDAKLVSKDYLG